MKLLIYYTYYLYLFMCYIYSFFCLSTYYLFMYCIIYILVIYTYLYIIFIYLFIIYLYIVLFIYLLLILIDYTCLNYCKSSLLFNWTSAVDWVYHSMLKLHIETNNVLIICFKTISCLIQSELWPHSWQHLNKTQSFSVPVFNKQMERWLIAA